MRNTTPRWIVAGLLVCCIAPSAAAQLTAVHVPSAFPVDRNVVLYMELSPVEDAEALALALPMHMDLVSVRRRTVRDWQDVRMQAVRDREGRFFTPRPEPGLYALTLMSRNSTDRRMATLAVVGAGDDGVLRIPLPASGPVGRTPFRSLHMTRRTPGMNISVPGSWSAGRTVELWMRTAEPDGIIASTWTGEESEAYPLEIVVDAEGHLEAYRGDGGRHGSVRSRAPVADGLWQHVAVTSGEWMKLYVNGVPHDSLLTSMIPVQEQPGRAFTLGRRPGSTSGSYTGDVDELRVWSGVRTRAVIRSSMLQHSSTLEDTPLFFDSFEEETPEHIRSDLLLYRPPNEIRVRFDGSAAQLSWTAAETGIRLFHIERRSRIGTYETVGVVPSGSSTSYSWRDVEQEPGIRYYRIRQVHTDGASVASAAVKVGFGDSPDAEELPVRITGNYPNPFQPRTMIAYLVDEPTRVRLTVWDLSGQLVRVLVDGVQSSGLHEVPFDGDGLPSGSYFARLETDGHTQTHQMVLTK